MYINNISSIKHIHIMNLNGHLLNLLKKKIWRKMKSIISHYM